MQVRTWGLFLPILLSGQDTLRFMAYNLLRYGATPGYCDIRCKDAQLRTILSYVRPHVIGFNEIAPSPGLFRRLLDSVLNIGGITYWRSSSYSNPSNSDIVNGLFYDSRRLGWLRQDLITTQGGLRDIYAYHLYYLEPTLAQTQDTLFLIAIVSHLKAGNTPADAQTRSQAALQIQQYIENLPLQRRRFVVEMGDHNLYGAGEMAYQTLTQTLVDPGPAGPWSGNPAYAFFHTQSTRVQSLADGGSGGGMDDRFDFIFFSPSCTTQSGKARYIPGSLRAVGQDGQRFKQALTSPPLPSGYSAALINALYAMSDHLPVIADFALSVVPAATSLQTASSLPLSISVNKGELALEAQQPISFRLVDVWGKEQHKGSLSAGETLQLVLPSGIYLLQIFSPVAETMRIVLFP
ncbi:MAG: hypothetical protein N2170_08525 [Bacteroidia bacterium]|nr:hypothetical protein [Bacteroidia bacterium]